MLIDYEMLPAFVQEVGLRSTSFGLTLYIKIRREDFLPMSWSEIWQVFSDRYPDRWAVQMFPPQTDLVDEANVYHLYILDAPPEGVNIHHWH